MSRSITADRFLGGRVEIVQGSYRAGLDPVLLAAAVPAADGERALDLGCGAGVALYCLGARVPGLELWGLERDAALADLARQNAARNGVRAEIVTGDLSAIPRALRAESFDHVMMNPPFFAAGTASDDGGRRSGRHEDTPLAAWCDAALRRLRPGGSLTVIQRTERLPELLSALAHRAGAITLRPLAPREGRAPKLILLSGRKGARAPFRLAAPFVLHAGDSHRRDGDDYTPAASAVLRDAAPLPL